MFSTVCCRGDGIYRSILSWEQQIIGGSYLCLFSVRLYKHSYCIINIRVKPALFLYTYCSHPQDNSCITALQREFIPRTSIHWRLSFLVHKYLFYDYCQWVEPGSRVPRALQLSIGEKDFLS